MLNKKGILAVCACCGLVVAAGIFYSRADLGAPTPEMIVQSHPELFVTLEAGKDITPEVMAQTVATLRATQDAVLFLTCKGTDDLGCVIRSLDAAVKMTELAGGKPGFFLSIEAGGKKKLVLLDMVDDSRKQYAVLSMFEPDMRFYIFDFGARPPIDPMVWIICKEGYYYVEEPTMCLDLPGLEERLEVFRDMCTAADLAPICGLNYRGDCKAEALMTMLEAMDKKRNQCIYFVPEESDAR